MDKLKMHTPNQADENFHKLAALFPNAVTETIDEATGEVVRAIDKDVLMQEISARVVDGREERYQFTWPDRRKAILAANAPIAATLRPIRADSVGCDGTPGGWDSQNLYIEGDNLDVLKLLQETYLGKIKMIYIDPPYNTGSDFVYEDDFAEDADSYLERSGQFDDQGNRLEQNTESNGRFHTDWLNMMYSRLRIAKNLLSDTGVLIISIGYHEVNNLVMLCEQLFSNKQVMAVTIQTSGGKPNSGFNITHEYLVFIAPKDFIPIPTEEDMKEYASPYHGMTLATFNQIQRPNQAYPIYVDDEGCIIGCGRTLQERIEDGSYQGELGDFVYKTDDVPSGATAIWPISAKGEQCVWRLIPNRLLGDYAKGYIKVIPTPSDKAPQPYGIQYLSEGIIQKILSGELSTYRISDNPRIPTIEIKDYKTAGAGISTIWTDKKFFTAKGNEDIDNLFTAKPFSYPKPVSLLSYLIKRITVDDDIILDFFSGSGTTAHAVMQENLYDKGHRKFILVQLPEVIDPEKASSDNAKKVAKNAVALLDSIHAPHNICEIGKERIRRAGCKIKDQAGMTATDLDIGFRVLRLDSSNMQDVYYNPTEMVQSLLDLTTDNIKPDRTPEDLLFQVMLDLGVELSSVIEETVIEGKKVFDVADGFLLACFDTGVTTEAVTAIAKKKPYYAVFRDSSMANDSVATNFDQIFETYSPQTTRKVL